jgi:hypothetical protein
MFQLVQLVTKLQLGNATLEAPASFMNPMTGYKADVCRDTFSCHGAAKAATTNLSKL